MSQRSLLTARLKCMRKRSWFIAFNKVILRSAKLLFKIDADNSKDSYVFSFIHDNRSNCGDLLPFYRCVAFSISHLFPYSYEYFIYVYKDLRVPLYISAAL